AREDPRERVRLHQRRRVPRALHGRLRPGGARAQHRGARQALPPDRQGDRAASRYPAHQPAHQVSTKAGAGMTTESVASRLEGVLDNISEGIPEGRLPAFVFNDQGIFDLEQDRVFSKTWSFLAHETEDRKSTRLNSSHVSISYAVFCL